MRKGNHSKSRASKGLVLMLALVLLVGVAVGGTVAWLSVKSNTVTNTFTTSMVDITLTETGTTDNAKSYKMIPGEEYGKDPLVTVLKGSEACWVFVKMEETNKPADYLDYSVNTTNWTKLTGVDGVNNVWYKQVGAKGDEPLSADVKLQVLTGDKVTVKNTLTKTEMTAAAAAQPALSFTAYAIQQSGFDSVTAAWKEVSKLG